MTSYLMVQAIWRICIILAPPIPSITVKALLIRRWNCDMSSQPCFGSPYTRLPVLSLLPRGNSPSFPSPSRSPLTFNMKWSWHFIVYSPRLGHFSLGGRRNLRSGIILADKTRCCSRGRGLKRRSLNAAGFVE